MIYLSYKKSSNIRKNLQHYSQDVNYYETVKKNVQKSNKIFLPVDNMYIASLRQSNESSLLKVRLTIQGVVCDQLWLWFCGFPLRKRRYGVCQDAYDSTRSDISETCCVIASHRGEKMCEILVKDIDFVKVNFETIEYGLDFLFTTSIPH